MIKEYVFDLASQMGMKITKVSLSGGPESACLDYRLDIASQSHVASTLIHQSEVDSLQNRSCSAFLELKIKATLERLKLQLEP